jgi:hypothetical protein
MEKNNSAIWNLKRVVVVVLMVVSCRQSPRRYADQHRQFHEKHAGFIADRREDIAVRMDRLVVGLETGQEPENLFSHWTSILGLLEETRHKSEVYEQNCLVLDETVNVITEMHTARGALASTVLTRQTELESAIRRRDDVAAQSIARELRADILKQLDALVTGSRAYLEILETGSKETGEKQE